MLYLFSTGVLDRYRLPYEREVGTRPSVEAMTQCVSVLDARPIFQHHWLDHPVSTVHNYMMYSQLINKCNKYDNIIRNPCRGERGEIYLLKPSLCTNP